MRGLKSFCCFGPNGFTLGVDLAFIHYHLEAVTALRFFLQSNRFPQTM